MIYSPHEKYYRQDELAFLRRALPLIIPTVGMWCSYYTIGGPVKKMPIPRYPFYNFTRGGKLPSAVAEKRKFLTQITSYLLDELDANSFLLWLDPAPIPRFCRQQRVYKFDHHDDTCSWALNLSDDEYAMLRKDFSENGLPADFFQAATSPP